MKHLHAGLDVSDKTTSICIVDKAGVVVFEGIADTAPASIALALKPYKRSLRSVGQESGIKAAWLHRELVRAKYPMLCLDARHAHAALGVRINKTDANDAYGLALLLARGIYTLAHVRSVESIRIKTFLGLRRSMVRKAKDLHNAVLTSAKQLGPAAGKPLKHTALDPTGMSAALASISRAHDGLKKEIRALDKIADAMAEDHPVCARLMGIPGVGPITSLVFVAGVDDPHRFKSSRDVAAFFGLTPRVQQSGQSSHSGGISHAGDVEVRAALCIAARVLLGTSRSECALRRWGLRIQSDRGPKIAYVACARKLAVLMHHLWVTGQDFDPAR